MVLLYEALQITSSMSAKDFPANVNTSLYAEMLAGIMTVSKTDCKNLVPRVRAYIAKYERIFSHNKEQDAAQMTSARSYLPAELANAAQEICQPFSDFSNVKHFEKRGQKKRKHNGGDRDGQASHRRWAGRRIDR